MITAIVLAAGAASRFGQCKQLIRLGKKNMLTHVLDNLVQSNANEIVVVLGARDALIRQEVAFRRARVIANSDHAAGISSSIQSGLRCVSGDTTAIMFVLGDQPFVRTETFNRLCDQYRRDRPGILIPTRNGVRGNPVIIDQALFPELRNLRGDNGCRTLFGPHAAGILEVPVDDAGIVMDIDTAGDVAAARKLGLLGMDEQELTPHVV